MRPENPNSGLPMPFLTWLSLHSSTIFFSIKAAAGFLLILWFASQEADVLN
jgi:hypothetical protein